MAKMDEIRLTRKPTDDELKAICIAVEEAAKGLVYSRIPAEQIDNFEVLIEAEGERPLTLTVDLSLELRFGSRAYVEKLLGEAMDAAFRAAEGKARELNIIE